MSSTELVSVEPLLPMEPDQARAAMAKFQALTDAMLTDEDRQRKDAQNRPLPKPFVKRSGWRKISTGYTLSCKILSEEITRDENGQPIRAHVRVLVTHPSGREWEGSGGCSILESSFNAPNKRAKAEHDIPATAFTRAVNRATSDLVGFGQVSAEEIDGAAPDPGQSASGALAWGPVADDEQMNQAANLVRAIAAPVEVDGEKFILAMGQHFDGVPQACVTMLRGLARYIGDARARQAPPENAPPDPAESAYHQQPSPADVYPEGRYQSD